MEFHKPHAAKTWKEFFIELGTIVVSSRYEATITGQLRIASGS